MTISVGAILTATNSSFQKGMTFYRSIYVKKAMKLLAFIFEQPSYVVSPPSIDHILVVSSIVLFRFLFLGHLSQRQNVNYRNLWMSVVHRQQLPQRKSHPKLIAGF